MRPAVPLAATVAQVDAEFPGPRPYRRRGDRPLRSGRRHRFVAARGRGWSPRAARQVAGRRPPGRAGRAQPGPPGQSPAGVMRISSAPTASNCPTSPPSACTVPAIGDGISTVALSVITSASGWSSATTSPGATCQATSSTSAMPSPRSGTLTTCALIAHGSIAALAAPPRRAAGRGSRPIPARADTACPSPSRARSAPRRW